MRQDLQIDVSDEYVNLELEHSPCGLVDAEAPLS